MATLTTPAILLRRVAYGDYDLVVTFFTLDQGKIAAIAKSARKSVKRFAGVLELFSAVQVVFNPGRGKGLPVLKEATLMAPFDGIRTDVAKTAYASYWAEIIDRWAEERQPQPKIYGLLFDVLNKLNQGEISAPLLSIVFQMHFLNHCGLGPNLSQCGLCSTQLDHMPAPRVLFDLSKGGILCQKCTGAASGRKMLAKGTLKQLQWIASGDWAKAGRLRFTEPAMAEALELLEAFIPYHLGREPRSLGFLRQIRT